MYGIKKHHNEDDLDEIKVVIADHKVGSLFLTEEFTIEWLCFKEIDLLWRRHKWTQDSAYFTTETLCCTRKSDSWTVAL